MKEFDVNSIDRGKAPEDATHFTRYCDEVYWMKNSNNTWYYKYSPFDSGEWKVDNSDQDPSEFIPLPTEQNRKEWDGVSKLEVGMICEAWYSAQKGWRESEVLKTDFDEYDVPIIAVRDVETDYLFWAHDFRPLKSKEQIEREEALEEMYKDLEGCISAKEISKYLISKGWRKTE